MNDYIRTYLGLMGSGKTTRAAQDVERHPRVIVYSPGTTNEWLLKYPHITDEPNYLKDIEKFLQMHPRLRIEKRAVPSDVFKILSRVRGYSILLDDIAVLKTHPVERADFEGFLPTIRQNGNQVIITTHRARKTLPPIVHNIGTSFYYVGPGTRSRREIEQLYDLSNYPIGIDEFTQRLINNPKRSGESPAGIFPIRVAT